jgi:hypothetical protein
LHRLEINAERQHAVVQQAQFLVENEQRRLLAALDGGGGEIDREQGFAGAGRAQDQGARSSLDTAAQQGVQTLMPLLNCRTRVIARCSAPPCAGRRAAIAHDGEVMEPATVFLAAIFDHPHPPTLGAVVGGQFLQANHAVGDL